MIIFRKLPAVLILLTFFVRPAIGQGNIHQQSKEYEWPTDSLVKKKLEAWRDLKFGIIIHWGLYAVPGIIESWGLCSEPWINRDSTMTYDGFKTWYWGMKDQFNPRQFNPDQWALAAKAAGMRYLVFTTKHHDGFCMFDTHQTDFKITAGPFADHPKANVAKEVFSAFRKQDFMIGAYFSKPDWHSEYYWWPRYATADRNNNYDIRTNPWRWNKFKSYTKAQIGELMTDYNKIDILWLDGGWVRPLETVNDEVRAWGAAIPAWSQDIDMPAIATMAREKQPGLLIVDRTVHGPYENYQTPEQSIPANRQETPWESCITLGGAWGFVPNDQYKSAATVVHNLIEVVAKGGSLLLGVGPRPDGTIGDAEVQRLKEIGDWLKVNGEGIYGTRSVEHFRDGDTFFTRGKDGTMYALVCFKTPPASPTTVSWKGHQPKKGTKLKVISTGRTLSWTKTADGVSLTLPAVKDPNGYYPAAVLSFKE
jgi:alpha-L-fucosidase